MRLSIQPPKEVTEKKMCHCERTWLSSRSFRQIDMAAVTNSEIRHQSQISQECGASEALAKSPELLILFTAPTVKFCVLRLLAFKSTLRSCRLIQNNKRSTSQVENVLRLREQLEAAKITESCVRPTRRPTRASQRCALQKNARAARAQKEVESAGARAGRAGDQAAIARRQSQSAREKALVMVGQQVRAGFGKTARAWASYTGGHVRPL